MGRAAGLRLRPLGEPHYPPVGLGATERSEDDKPTMVLIPNGFPLSSEGTTSHLPPPMLYGFLNKLFKKREDSSKSGEDGDIVKPFLDHLEDLRWTIIKMAITLMIGMVACFVFAHDLVKILQWPIHWAGIADKVEIRAPSPFNAIMAAIQLSFYAAVTVTLPLLMYFLGEFVLPALTKREKRYIIPALGVGFALFLGGVLFCFTQVLPGMLKFLHNYTAKMDVKDMWDLKTYCAFVAHLCIAFGLLCELPVVVITLNFIGVVTYKGLASTRAYAFTGILILCAIVSPSPDLATLFMLALPIVALYELCIWIVWYLDKRRDDNDRRGGGGAAPYNDPLEPID
jgi:sec-independent protein translocase protein TatC